MSPPEYDHPKLLLPNFGYFCHHCTGRSLSWSPLPPLSPSLSAFTHCRYCSKCHFESPYLRVQPPPYTANEVFTITLQFIYFQLLPGLDMLTSRSHINRCSLYVLWSFRFALADSEASDCNLQSMQVDNGVKITAARVCCPLPSTLSLSLSQFFPRRPQLRSDRDMISSTPHGGHHSRGGNA